MGQNDPDIAQAKDRMRMRYIKSEIIDATTIEQGESENIDSIASKFASLLNK